MAKTQNVEKPVVKFEKVIKEEPKVEEVHVNKIENKKFDISDMKVIDKPITPPTPAGVAYKLDINCDCGGSYIPTIEKINYRINTVYRCNKCNKAITVKLVPAK